MNPIDIQTDFNNVMDDVGQTVLVSMAFAASSNHDIYGDFSTSGSNLYVSGVSALTFIQPRNTVKLDIQPFSSRLDGDVIGFFKSGVAINLGHRVSGNYLGDYRVNSVSDYTLGSILVYKVALLDTLNK